MRVLVITHGNDAIYGAATSLKYLLHNCNWDFDLVYTKSFLHNTSDINMMKYTNNRAGKIRAFFLPFVCKSVFKTVSFRTRCSRLLYTMFILKDNFKLQRFIENGQYDYILLNSLVLYPLVNKKNKYVVYIREMCVANKRLKKRVVNKLNQADKLIYIDPALTKPLNEVTTKSLIINNPFDMSKLEMIDAQTVKKLFPQIDLDKKIISIIGMVDPVKGVDFAIDVFKKVKREDIILLIVGNGNDKDYVSKCKENAQGCSNIIFLGEQKEIQFIYYMSDYILRADAFFVTGRTVYEGLYAGCNVIIQSDSEKDKDKDLFQEYELFQKQIFFYKTRDSESLLSLISNIPDQKIEKKEYKSNVEEYVRRVENFMAER